MDLIKGDALLNLYACYKPLLSDKKQKILDMFLVYDNTLVEIADEEGVTRQNIRNIISDSEKQLNCLEESLQILKKKSLLLDEIEKASYSLDAGNVANAKKCLDKMKKII